MDSPLSHLKIGVLGPLCMFPKLPAVISPNGDDGWVSQAEIVQRVEHLGLTSSFNCLNLLQRVKYPANLRINVGHSGVVGFPAVDLYSSCKYYAALWRPQFKRFWVVEGDIDLTQVRVAKNLLSAVFVGS